MTQIADIKQNARKFLEAGRLPEAAGLYLQAVKLSPTDIDAWHMLAVVNGMLGKLEEAESCCRKVIRLQPQAYAAHNNLGNILKNQGKYKSAEKAYRQALKVMPGYAEAANNLGTLLRETGRENEALRYYRTAVKLEPGYALAHSNLGAMLQAQGLISDAIKSYQQALQLQPNNPEVVYNLGSGLLEAGHIVQATTVFQHLVILEPKNTKAWTSLGAAQVRSKQYQLAVESCMKAIAINPENWEAYFHLGTCYQGLEQKAEAERMYRKALELKPDLQSARYFLSVLGAETAPEKSPAEYVKDLFDGYAETFDNQLVGELEYRTPDYLHELVSNRLDGNPAKLDVIDLGCGTGLCGPLFRDMASRLVGVDLSPKMVEKCRSRHVYDELIVDDLIPPLEAGKESYDLALAADVFVYIGDLHQVVSAVSAALRPGGLFVFSTEQNEGPDDYSLLKSGRYAHNADYIVRLADAYGLKTTTIEPLVLRKEAGLDIKGNAFVLEKAPGVGTPQDNSSGEEHTFKSR